MSSQQDTLVSLSATPGNGEARKMTAISGRKLLPLLHGQDRATSVARMLLGTSAWASTRCFLTWKAKVTPAKRLLFRLVPSMPRTEETASGLWPTPTVDSATERANNYAQGGTPLTVAVKLWPTPTEHGNHNQPGSSKNAGWGLSSAVKLWPTPKSSASGPDFARAERTGSGGDDLATTVAKMYPSPDVGMAKGRGEKSAAARSRLGGSLNPEWVEWLMGFPEGWTDLER